MNPFNIEQATVYQGIPDGCEVVHLGGVYGDADEDCDGQATVWRDTTSRKFISGYVTGGGANVMLAGMPEGNFNAAMNWAERFALLICGERN